jgi:outer membrane protein OmpA-like peptidoglycan-associated protein
VTARALAAALFLAAAPAAALDLPAGADLALAEREAFGSQAIPVGPWQDGRLPSIRAEGTIEREVWHLRGVSGTLEQLVPLRDQLLTDGFEILLDCQTEECGGFDFRYAVRALPEPEMHVDLGDFRFLSARRGAGDEARFVTLMVSRTSALGYVQITRVEPAAAPPPALSTQGTRPPSPGASGAVPSLAVPALSPPAADAPQIVAALEREGRAVLADLAFETGSSSLSPGPFASLETLAAYLAADPGRRVVLVGHTDAEGGLEANVALSRARARSVLDRLVSEHGASRSQLAAEGVGYLLPLAPNSSDEGRALNRRVEAVLTSTE